MTATEDTVAALKRLRQKIQRATVANNREDRARVSLELALAVIAVRQIAAALTDEATDA